MGFAVKTHCSLYFEIPQNHRSDDYSTLINQDLKERNVAMRDRERNRESNTEERERGIEP
jgi:hypothetical protein